MYMHVPSKCVAGSQKCCKDLANTKLDLRNAANSLQIASRPNPLGGGVERRRTGPCILITGWWFLTILKNMKVNGKDYPIYYGK